MDKKTILEYLNKQLDEENKFYFESEEVTKEFANETYMHGRVDAIEEIIEWIINQKEVPPE